MTKHVESAHDHENPKRLSRANRSPKKVLIKKENKKTSKKSVQPKTAKASSAIIVESILMKGPSIHESVVQAQIAMRAHELYRHRGGHHGQDLEDWLTAEREVWSEKSCCS